MEDYKIIRQKLDELRQDILEYQNSDDEKQDLMEHFFKVKETSPETYELLVLIYNEFQISSKSSKKQLIQMIDKALNIKTKTVDKMIIERTKNSPIHQRVWGLFTWQNTKRLVSVWVIIISILFIMYKIDNNAFNALSKNFNFLYSETLNATISLKEK